MNGNGTAVLFGGDASNALRDADGCAERQRLKTAAVVKLPRTRNDPILPARVAHVCRKDPRAGRLFSPAHRMVAGERLLLPGFGARNPDYRGPSLPLPYLNLGADEDRRAGGYGAPLALRLFIEGILCVQHAEDRPVQIDLRLRDLRSLLYPGPRRPRPAEIMPRINAAAKALDKEMLVPYRDPGTGQWMARRHVVWIDAITLQPERQDAMIRMFVALPPGCADGPVIDRGRLRFWGVRSAVCYRALLTLAHWWWNPGRLQLPLPGNRWAQVQGPPSRFGDAMSDDDLADLFYPLSNQRRQRDLRRRARKTLDDLVEAGDVRWEERRLLPPAD